MATLERDREYLTVDEAARLLRQSRQTVRRKVAAGDIRAVRLGEFGPLRIPADAIDAYLEGGRPPIEGAAT